MDVSQGSSATPLRCGGIFNDDFVAYLVVNLSVKKFENRSTFGEIMYNIVVPCFFDSQCILAGGSSVPLVSARKGTDPHWKRVRFTYFASCSAAAAH